MSQYIHLFYFYIWTAFDFCAESGMEYIENPSYRIFPAACSDWPGGSGTDCDCHSFFDCRGNRHFLYLGRKIEKIN